MYQKTKSSWIKHLDFMILDIVCLELLFLFAFMLRYDFKMPESGAGYGQMAVIMILIDLCVVLFRESYQGVLARGYWLEFKAAFSHVSVVVMLMVMCMFAMHNSATYSRSVLLMLWSNGVVLLCVTRTLLKVIVRKKLKNNKEYRSIIVVTSKEFAYETVESVQKKIYRDYQITGFIIMDQKMTGETILDIPVVASKENALEYMKSQVVDEVFFNLPPAIPLPEEIMDGCIAMGIVTHLNLLRISALQGNKSVERFADYTVVTTSIKQATDRQLFLKRAMDIIGGSVGLLITAIAFLVVAPIIYIQSPGPIFFTQERIGKSGRPFKIYKFRSMYMDAEERKKELMAQNEMTGHMFKLKNDPRIFPFGNFMRKTSIDELPQFINILKGEMSLVGTRPPTRDEYQQYEYWHKKRLAIKPGLTGLWQVSGRSDITDFEEVVELDARYILEWDIGMDLRILLKTVVVVFGRMGAK